uniref:Odorant receptor n=1 Tax=Anopheles farauti TaxID=69004 RepID=A0A182QQD7_9DIPT
MEFFGKFQQNAELSYRQLYQRFNWFLKIALLRVFDDDFLVTPMSTVIFYFYATQISISLTAVILHVIRYRDDIDSVILSVSAFVSALELVLKLIGMVLRRKQIVQMINSVLNDRSDQAGPIEAAIYGKYLRLASMTSLEVIVACGEILRVLHRKLLYVTIVSYLTAGAMLLLYPVVTGKIGKRILAVGFSVPFVDYHRDPWYLINYVLQVVQIQWIALLFIGLDGPFYLFVCYSASQLEILIVYLRRIGDCPDNVQEQRQLIRKVFNIHMNLSNFLAKCSNVYREVYLKQVFCSIVHICVSLFHIQLKFNNGSYGMLLTNVNKMWLFCYCGQLVVSKAAEFGASVYANYWYQLWNRHDLQDILFMLCNAQRNYGFSIGGFGYLSFDTFTTILKTSYSFNAFLHQVMN